MPTKLFAHLRHYVLALTIALMAAWLLPAGAQAGPYVLSQADPGDPPTPPGGVSGLSLLGSAGGETLKATTGGAAITGTGVGPIVYTTSGGGIIRQFSGGAYHNLATGVGTDIRSMTVTGHGLVVANGSKLQTLSGGHLNSTPIAHTSIPDGPWISITTEPNGLLLGWAFHGGVGRLYEFNLSTGHVDTQDFVLGSNDPLLNNCVPLDSSCTRPPVANSGGISADSQGGIWVASAGYNDSFNFPTSQSSQVWYAAPTTGSFGFNSVGSMLTRPHVSASAEVINGDPVAYVSSTDNEDSPYQGDVYKFTPTNQGDDIVSSTDDLYNSYLTDLAVDRCYTFCSVSSPSNPGGGAASHHTTTSTQQQPLTPGPKPKLNAPRKSVKLGKKGLKLKLKCDIACNVTVTGKLVFGKVGSATASASNKVKKTKASLKAGKSKTLTVKLSKAERKRVKRAMRRHRKVIAKLKVVTKSTGHKTGTRKLKLRVK